MSNLCCWGLPAGELALQAQGDGESDIFSPWGGGNLHAYWQAGGGNAATDHGGRPSGHVVRHGVAEAVEVPLQDGCAMRQRGVGVNRGQDDVVAAKKRGDGGAVSIP